MVTELILVRHGEIDANVQRLWYGTTDSELNQTGTRQAAALGQRVHDKYPNITKVYCSPLKRTLNTAKALAEGIQQTPELCRDLIEYGIGELEGTSHHDLHEVHDFFTHIAKSQDYALPGGESVNDVSRRVTRAVDRMIADHPGERVALVGHGAAFGILLATLLDGKPFPFSGRHLSNTGIAHLRVGDSVELIGFDDTEHLYGLLDEPAGVPLS
ncbi:MAG: broad specificity phosphatase PhoE [Candidatus Azotimanducaceae bacterium]